MHLKKTLGYIFTVLLTATGIIVFHLLLSKEPTNTLSTLLLPMVLLSGLIVALLYRFILHPLHLIEHALHHKDPSGLGALRTTSGRFGLLADLVAESFQQREQLHQEVLVRKKTEAMLVHQEKMYRGLFESAADALLCVDSEGTIRLANTASRELFKVPPSAQSSSRQLTGLFAKGVPGEITSYLLSLGETTEPMKMECDLQQYSGERFNAELRAIPLPILADEPLCLLYITDITQRKKTELEKQRLQDQFEVVYKMEAIGQLAGGIAHEYNNILGAIAGYADLIRQRYSADERLTKYAGMILNASKRASELTRKLLIFARKNRLNLADFNVHDAIEEAVDLLNHTVEKTINIIRNDSAPQAFIFGDVSQFQNAVMNLALNSRDAMPEGGTLTIVTSVADVDRDFHHRRDFSVAPGKYVAISITDTGCGMEPDVLSHIFEPFFTTKDIGQGTGLGLASVYGTIRSHHGFIDVKSSPGEGTTFTLYFPLVEHEPLTTAGAVQPHTAGRGAILFIDDESILRDAVREMLTLIGYTVTTGIDGEDAISLFSANPDRFDLVILDMKMPGMSGVECFRKLKAVKPDIRALLSTGYSIDEERQSLLNEGFTGIIQKPYVSSQLAQAVQAILPPDAGEKKR